MPRAEPHTLEHRQGATENGRGVGGESLVDRSWVRSPLASPPASRAGRPDTPRRPRPTRGLNIVVAPPPVVVAGGSSLAAAYNEPPRPATRPSPRSAPAVSFHRTRVRVCALAVNLPPVCLSAHESQNIDMFARMSAHCPPAAPTAPTAPAAAGWSVVSQIAARDQHPGCSRRDMAGRRHSDS